MIERFLHSPAIVVTTKAIPHPAVEQKSKGQGCTALGGEVYLLSLEVTLFLLPKDVGVSTLMRVHCDSGCLLMASYGQCCSRDLTRTLLGQGNSAMTCMIH